MVVTFTVKSIAMLSCLVVLMAVDADAANYDESKVPDYTLPDPLKLSSGEKVNGSDAWEAKRRGEILALFQEHVYGKSPSAPQTMSFDVASVARDALSGEAVRKVVTIWLNGNGRKLDLNLLVYLPAAAAGPCPVFVGLNFGGNHTIANDPAIPVSTKWMRRGPDHRATEKSRGASAARWPVEEILARGYGVATIYCGDIDPDFHDGFTNGVHPLFDAQSGDKRPPDAWGTIGAWAWGLSRAMDYFEFDPEVDENHVAVLGHSRLGKTALWAGARDQRFALVISNDSGCGGAALSRRCFGETVKRINTSFPHWFCDNFKKYNDNEGALPVDQHMLIALAAPRPVYAASATEDRWADPRGEFLAAKHAEPVYALYGKKGLGSGAMPKPDTPLATGSIGYHIRTGRHNITSYDWNRYMDFADKQFGLK